MLDLAGVLAAVGNSALIAVIATVLAVALGAMAAFALSRYAFRGREALYTLFTLGLLFPLGVATLPLYLLLRNSACSTTRSASRSRRRRSRSRSRS